MISHTAFGDDWAAARQAEEHHFQESLCVAAAVLPAVMTIESFYRILWRPITRVAHRTLSVFFLFFFFRECL